MTDSALADINSVQVAVLTAVSVLIGFAVDLFRRWANRRMDIWEAKNPIPTEDSGLLGPKKVPLALNNAERNERTYYVLSGALTSGMLAMVLFSVSPLLPEPNPLLAIEVAIATIAGLSAVGIILHTAGYRDNPLAWYGFAGGAVVGVLTIIAFVAAETDAKLSFRVIILLFLISTIAISIVLHIDYGGRRGR